MRLLSLLLLSVALLAGDPRPRLIVLTDISSLTAAVREPDDGQSLIRLLVHSNEFRIEALVASSNLGHGQTVRPELIQQVIEAYGTVQPQLARHAKGFPEAKDLAKRVHAGQPVAGPQVPIEGSAGAGKETAGSRAIAELACGKGEPIWVLAWGGTADLAQALWSIRQQRPQDLARCVERLRVHAIYNQDATAAWIRREFPDLLWVERSHGVRGMYRGGEAALVGPEWVKKNVSQQGGALGALYPSYDGGDIWVRQLGPVRGVKEGDTPSFLALLPNGLTGEQLNGSTWGGRVKPVQLGARHYVEEADPAVPGAASDPDPRISAVYRWRQAVQNEFAARLQWAVREPSEANHPPDVRLRSAAELVIESSAGEVVDVTGSRDPDGDRLRYEWFVDPLPGAAMPAVELVGTGGPVVQVRPRPGLQPCTFSVVVAVTDDGTPALTRYQRVLVRVRQALP